MKRVCLLALLFVLLSVAGTAFGAFLCMMSWDLTVFVAGDVMSFFSLDFFVRGVLYSFPLVTVLSLLLLILYQIRHPSHPLFLVIVYTVFSLLLWLILFPLCAKAALFHTNEIVESDPLTTGLFRQKDGMVYYFSDVADDGETEGLSIDLYGREGSAGEVKPLEDFFVNSLRVGSYYADPIIEQAVRFPKVLSVPLNAYLVLFNKGVSAWDAGFLRWLQFSVLALALCSVLAVQYFTAWRLLNVFLVFLSSAAVVLVNVLGYSGQLTPEALEPILWKMQSWGLSDPVVFFLDILIFIALTITGIVMYRIRSSEAEAGETIV